MVGKNVNEQTVSLCDKLQVPGIAICSIGTGGTLWSKIAGIKGRVSLTPTVPLEMDLCTSAHLSLHPSCVTPVCATPQILIASGRRLVWSSAPRPLTQAAASVPSIHGPCLRDRPVGRVRFDLLAQCLEKNNIFI